jgi:hypothetical protein
MTRKEANDFKEILAQNVSRDSDFYRSATRAFGVLAEVRDNSDGHGITLVLKRDDGPSGLDDYMRNAAPYNSVPHSFDDADIAEVVVDERHKDLATIVNSSGVIIGAEVSLPVDIVEYQKKYGIDVPIQIFLGYNEGEAAPGGRTHSSLYATDKFGERVLILTLGENKPDGSKGSINAYYCGDRIYSGSGRRMRWELADPSRRPAPHKNVEPSPTSYYHHCGPRREESHACAMGGPL